MARMIQKALQECGKPHTDFSWRKYKLHYQRSLVQVGASLIMWFFALSAYVFDLISYHHFFGVSLVVLYLIAINPLKLWILKRIQGWDHLVSFLLFINFLEIIGYTAVIYFMGGIEATYLTILYATTIASVGSVSQRHHTFLVAGICILAYNAMILLEGANLIPWYKVIPDFHLPWSHRLTRMFVVDALMLLIAYITSYTAILLRKAKGDLQTAYAVLEQRVAERTKELSKANEELQSYIIEQKKADESIRASHERFLTVLNSIDATIYVADIETYEIIFMNKNMIETFGKDLTGEKCWKVFRGGSEPCHDCTNEKLIDENGKPVGVVAWQGQNPITKKWHTNFDRAIKWTDGRWVRLEIATDITDFKKMEQELQQSRKMESIGTLAGGIAHDFNNILFPIVGHTEMLLEDVPEDSPFRASLDQINTGALRATKLVKQILTFARQDKDKLMQMKMQPVIKEALQLLRSTIPTTIEIKQKIFDPFFTTKGIGKGTEMGLSVVHGIIKSMGGAIQVHSEPGKGTEFKLYFPIDKSHFNETAIQTKEPFQGGTERILLVDDEEAILTMEKLMLERLGYQVTIRTSSIEALEVFRVKPYNFDLVITDMAMPNMAGDKLSAELAKIRVDIPILLCTGYSEGMSKEKAASNGINIVDPENWTMC
jgi:CheY-like chemotaxis protein